MDILSDLHKCVIIAKILSHVQNHGFDSRIFRDAPPGYDVDTCLLNILSPASLRFRSRLHALQKALLQTLESRRDCTPLCSPTIELQVSEPAKRTFCRPTYTKLVESPSALDFDTRLHEAIPSSAALPHLHPYKRALGESGYGFSLMPSHATSLTPICAQKQTKATTQLPRPAATAGCVWLFAFLLLGGSEAYSL
ncbi:hypothetical protein BU16DRAFT_556934 [Lophium mytilinum]|uniref:Uncharacterized protein n=1 Tax=Lophium mytilinum TaxID=390894 RepID=A0A6A6R7E5_9PEZI|nr:hypothetical protein BU16DRAFT_556934 [Lophium mytilinum]